MIIDYEKFVKERSHVQDSIEYIAIGFGGEAGEVLNEIKKELRDGEDRRTQILLELGDVLYYMLRLGSKYGFTLQDIMDGNVQKLMTRDGIRDRECQTKS